MTRLTPGATVRTNTPLYAVMDHTRECQPLPRDTIGYVLEVYSGSAAIYCADHEIRVIPIMWLFADYRGRRDWSMYTYAEREQLARETVYVLQSARKYRGAGKRARS